MNQHFFFSKRFPRVMAFPVPLPFKLAVKAALEALEPRGENLFSPAKNSKQIDGSIFKQK
jgi:hypothetical protein